MVDFFQTSIVFTLNEGPGELFKALAVLSLRQINLTKVGFTIITISLLFQCVIHWVNLLYWYNFFALFFLSDWKSPKSRCQERIVEVRLVAFGLFPLKNISGCSIWNVWNVCRCFNYFFYLDFEASMADEAAQNAVKNLEVILLGITEKIVLYYSNRLQETTFAKRKFDKAWFFAKLWRCFFFIFLFLYT